MTIPRPDDGPSIVTAALVAGIGSGLPSTLHALVTGRDVLEATRAAGTMLRLGRGGDGHLVAAGLVAHALLTVGWTSIILPVLRSRRRPVLAGTAAGAAVAALDLSLAQRWFPRIAALPTSPQVADHLAFGALVGAAVATARRRAATGSPAGSPAG